MSETTQEMLSRLESQRNWWREQAEQVERDRKHLRYVPPIGCLVSIVVAWFSWAIGLGLLLITAAVWGMGLYLTSVRRTEFVEHVREVQTALDAARGTANAKQTASESNT